MSCLCLFSFLQWYRRVFRISYKCDLCFTFVYYMREKKMRIVSIADKHQANHWNVHDIFSVSSSFLVFGGGLCRLCLSLAHSKWNEQTRMKKTKNQKKTHTHSQCWNLLNIWLMRAAEWLCFHHIIICKYRVCIATYSAHTAK